MTDRPSNQSDEVANEGWHARWRDGRLGWHRDDVHPDLVAHIDRIAPRAGARILVPLCGKSVGLPWLAERGHHAVGVELVEAAAVQLFDAIGTAAERTEHGDMIRYRAATGSGSVTIWVGDVFDTHKGQVGAIDGVWDRAALVAISSESRPAYARHLRELTDNAPVLLNSFSYDESVMNGPPFSVREVEVRELYGGRDIDKLGERDALADIKFEGHDYWLSTTYLIG